MLSRFRSAVFACCRAAISSASDDAPDPDTPP